MSLDKDKPAFNLQQSILSFTPYTRLQNLQTVGVIQDVVCIMFRCCACSVAFKETLIQEQKSVLQTWIVTNHATNAETSTKLLQ